MKTKFAGIEVDDRMTLKEFHQKMGIETTVISINREPTAQEIIDSC